MFDTTIVSHLMFLYDNIFSAEDHLAMFRELVRVTHNESIIFSTKSLSSENSI